MFGALLVFANGRRYNFPFLHDNTVPKGANTITTLFYCVLRYFKTHGTGSARTARTLYIQCDGGAENINRTVFAFADMIVRNGWFTAVYIYRLPVGHSHQIVDQYFSVLKDKLRNNECRDIPELLNCLKKTNLTKEGLRDGVTVTEIIWLQAALDFTAFFNHSIKMFSIRNRIYGWRFTLNDDTGDVDVW